MNTETNIIGLALDIFGQRTGFKATWNANEQAVDYGYDGIIDLKIKDQEVHFYAEAKKDLRLYHIDHLMQAAQMHQPFMVVAETIATTAREELRKNGIAYLEANGNAFIDYHLITILIDGNKAIKETKPVNNRAFTKTGLKAVFHLLNDPEAITKTYRQLAEETAVGLGNITYIMDGLEEAGFILQVDKRKFALKNKKALLGRWLAGYRETLKPDLLRGTFRAWNPVRRNEWQKLDTNTIDIQWGGEAAGEILTGHLKAKNLTIYTDTLNVVTELALIPTEDGDFQIYERFWHKADDEGATIPPLLVYADLLLTDDPRCIETARLIYDKYLKDKFEENQA